MRYIPADKAAAFTRRVHRVQQTFCSHGIHKNLGDHSGFSDRLQVLLIYGQNLVKSLHGKQQAALRWQSAAT